MIFADKIIRLRKKNGWSQEELAEKMNVSRQAVSKWEGAQAIPDINKIIQLSELFSVTTDYLLKDDIEDEEYINGGIEMSGVRKVSLNDANRYIKWRAEAAWKIAFATFLCILSPVMLCLLAVASEEAMWSVSENMSALMGVAVLLVIVAAAVMIYLFVGFKNSEWEFLEEEPFDREYGVVGMVKEKQSEYYPSYIRSTVIGICLCVVSPFALFVGAFSEKDFFAVVGLCVTMLIVAIGVFMIIRAGVRMESMKKLLGTSEYSYEVKNKKGFSEAIQTAYWGLVVAIYLAVSFITFYWYVTWVIFPLAAGIYALIEVLVKRYNDSENDKK